jgi:hypothetical protein
MRISNIIRVTIYYQSVVPLLCKYLNLCLKSYTGGIHAVTDILAAVNPDVTSVAVISFISVIPECTLGYNEFNTLALAGC